MRNPHGNLADRSGSLVESHKGYDPRIVFFYFVLALMLVLLVGGLAHQQLFKVSTYNELEEEQNMRRVLMPGLRGSILDRNGQVLVTNKSHWTVVLHLAELQTELHRERARIVRNFREAEGNTKADVPSLRQLHRLARVSVVQRYLDQVNDVLQRTTQVDTDDLIQHFDQELLLPYTLVDGLDDADYARLIERLPVKSPLEVQAVSVRYYPFDSAAAHTLGYVRSPPANHLQADGFRGDNLKTFRMKNAVGVAGLEKTFDSLLQGKAGGAIYRVDPSGYRIDEPIEERKPQRGQNLVTSLDIDLQSVAEQAIGDRTGAAVALDVRTGEVLALVSKPDYNLNDFYPRLKPEVYAAMQAKGAEFNNAVSGRYPPGSTFKILTSIAGLRSGAITPDQPIIDCNGVLHKHGGRFVCYNGRGIHHSILLPAAIAQSCDIYFYQAGWLTSPERIAAEGRRFRLDQATGLESPNDSSRNLILPDPEWKRRDRKEAWYPGDTAHMAIGQGDVLLSPLQMACFTASVARNEVYTRPTLLHDPTRPRQRSESIGLTAAQRTALVEGMVDTTLPADGARARGTADLLTTVALHRIPGVRIAGKTGTAQKTVMKDGKLGTINLAWFIAFAPAENPEIAVAVMLEGEDLGEEFGGGRNSAPIAALVMKRYFEKKMGIARPAIAPLQN